MTLLFSYLTRIVKLGIQGLVAMEGSKSEAVFDALNVNPQLFVNEILNSVDDIVDDGFKFYER